MYSCLLMEEMMVNKYRKFQSNTCKDLKQDSMLALYLSPKLKELQYFLKVYTLYI